jgi:hypothetical protein
MSSFVWDESAKVVLGRSSVWIRAFDVLTIVSNLQDLVEHIAMSSLLLSYYQYYK